MTAIPLQGQEASRLPRWINLRQLGREFDMTGPQIGRHLDRLGLREDNRPSAKAVQSGVGRLLPSSAHAAIPVVQWHAAKAIQTLRAAGLAPADAFEVFCRAAVDKICTSLRSARRSGDRTAGETEIQTWWITKQFTEHLNRVPGNRRDEFIDALMDGLSTRKPAVDMTLAQAMLGALGELEGYQARMNAREIAQATARATRSATNRRL